VRLARVSQQCLHKNYPQMLEKEQWLLTNTPNLNGLEISCLGRNSRSYFETFIRSPKQYLNLKKIVLEKIWDNFPQVQLIKLSRVLQIVSQEYVNGDGRHTQHFLYSKKCSHLRCLRGLE